MSLLWKGAVMKKHVEGFNGRTFCGNVINDNTELIGEKEDKYMTDCKRCLGNLTSDYKYMMECLEELREFKKMFKELFKEYCPDCRGLVKTDGKRFHCERCGLSGPR